MYVCVIQTQYPPTSEFILKKTSLKFNYCYFYRLKNLLFLFLIYIYVKEYVFCLKSNPSGNFYLLILISFQVFVQKVVPEMDCLFVRTAANGQRVCVIKSVDGTTITSFCVHECEGSSRLT